MRGGDEPNKTLLRASCLTLEIRCYEAKVKRLAVTGNQTQDTSGLS